MKLVKIKMKLIELPTIGYADFYAECGYCEPLNIAAIPTLPYGLSGVLNSPFFITTQLSPWL